MAQDAPHMTRHDHTTITLGDVVTYHVPALARPIAGTVVRITTALDPRGGMVAVKSLQSGRVRSMRASSVTVIATHANQPTPSHKQACCIQSDRHHLVDQN